MRRAGAYLRVSQRLQLASRRAPLPVRARVRGCQSPLSSSRRGAVVVLGVATAQPAGSGRWLGRCGLRGGEKAAARSKRCSSARRELCLHTEALRSSVKKRLEGRWSAVGHPRKSQFVHWRTYFRPRMAPRERGLQLSLLQRKSASTLDW